jgi:hypothetical protein
VNRLGTLLVAALLLSASVACGGQGEGGGEGISPLPSATRSVTRTPVRPSASGGEGGPSIARPSRSESARPEPEPTRTRSAEPEPAPTKSAVPEPTSTKSAGPAPVQPSPTSTATTLTKTITPSPSSSPSQSEAASDTEESGVPGWVWLLALVVAAAVLAGLLLMRRRRHRAEWSAGLAECLAEISWLGHDLVPGLLAQDAAGRSGVWAIGRTRVLRLEQTLEGLVGGAPDDVTARHCSALSSSVQALRRVLDQSDAAGVIGGEATTTALREAQRALDEALVALQRPDVAGDAR